MNFEKPAIPWELKCWELEIEEKWPLKALETSRGLKEKKTLFGLGYNINNTILGLLKCD